MDLTVLFISLGSMAGIGFILSMILVIADKKLMVEEDPRVEKALGMLPGANCGACGFAGCSAYANALIEGKASVDACKPGGTETAKKLAHLLGLDEVSIQPKIARVLCSGGIKETVKNKVYVGVKTCTSAHLVGGEKACLYSCIGYGDCVEACPFEAMYMNDNGLPVVRLDKCTGCGECVKACPRKIIVLSEYDEVVHVYCSSHDKGAVVRKICKAGCIACGLCEKDDDTGAVKVLEYLAVIDHSVNKAPVKSTKRCPTDVIRISDPPPGYEQHFNEKKRMLEEKVETK